MTTWILALVLLGSGAGLGYRQGAIRVAFSLVGLITAALLASTLGHMAAPLLKFVIKNLVLRDVVGLLIGFIAVLSVFKIVGLQTHKTVETHYHDAGDFKYGLWQRLNMRLGLCLGLVNGLFYLVLVSAAIYMGSYWSVQITPAENQQKVARVLNMLGKDLETSGMTKVAESVNQMPESYYQAADVVGLVFNNPAVEHRLTAYPAFLTLSQVPELKTVANDPTLNDLMATHPPLSEVMKNPRIQEILNNPTVMKALQAAVEPNLVDLKTYLETGQSAKFSSEPFLGRWVFDLKTTLNDYRKEKPSMPSAEIAKVRVTMDGRYGRGTVVVGTDQHAYLMNFPKPNAAELATFAGQWSNAGAGDYLITMDDGGEPVKVQMDSGRISLHWEGMFLTFVREQ